MRDLTAQKEAEASLRLAADLIEHVTDAIIATDTDGAITSWNPAAVELYGWPASQALGQNASALLTGTGDRPSKPLKSSGRERAHHHRMDGATVEVSMSVADIKDRAGQPRGRVMIASDLRHQREAERVRRDAEARYAAAVGALDEGVLIIDVNGVVETANPTALALLNIPDPIGRRFTDCVRLLDEAGLAFNDATLGLRQARETGIGCSGMTAALRRPNEATAFLSVSLAAIPSNDSGSPYAVVMCLLDVTDRHAAAALLRYEARHDQMTGLANRTQLVETINDWIATTASSVGVLFIDLDRFKMVNDSLGHEAGDAVLRTIARRLAATAPEDSTTGRLAGDEFVIVIPNASESKTNALANALIERISEPVDIGGREIVVTCSIGTVVSEATSANVAGRRIPIMASDLLRNADVAMYSAKQHGRNRVASYDDTLRRRAVDRLELQEAMRRGLERGEFCAAFQPIVPLRPSGTPSVEALARWTHENRGLIPPATFIPIAEESGLIVPLGDLMLQQSTSQLAQWRRRGLADLVMSVNLSARQLADPRLAHRVAELLATHDLPGTGLTLEITESALMDDPDLAARTLTSLRNLGVGISIDDFGTGYSSLSYLHLFPVTAVKIDRSFIDNLTTKPSDQAIVAGVISLAHALGLTVVAEGVETTEQLQILRQFDCDTSTGLPIRQAQIPQRDPRGTPTLVRPTGPSLTPLSNGSRFKRVATSRQCSDDLELCAHDPPT